jgi:hypothetical protein
VGYNSCKKKKAVKRRTEKIFRKRRGSWLNVVVGGVWWVLMVVVGEGCGGQRTPTRVGMPDGGGCRVYRMMRGV